MAADKSSAIEALPSSAAASKTRRVSSPSPSRRAPNARSRRAVSAAGVGDSSSTVSPASGIARASSRIPSGLPAASASTRPRTYGDSPDAMRSSNLSASLPYIAVEINREAAANDGLTEIAVGTAVTQAMNPSSSGSFSPVDAGPRSFRPLCDISP